MLDAAAAAERGYAVREREFADAAAERGFAIR